MWIKTTRNDNRVVYKFYPNEDADASDLSMASVTDYSTADPRFKALALWEDAPKWFETLDSAQVFVETGYILRRLGNMDAMEYTKYIAFQYTCHNLFNYLRGV